MHAHQFLVSVASPVSEMVLFKLGQISLLDHDTVQPVNFVDKYFCDLNFKSQLNFTRINICDFHCHCKLAKFSCSQIFLAVR